MTHIIYVIFSNLQTNSNTTGFVLKLLSFMYFLHKVHNIKA